MAQAGLTSPGWVPAAKASWPGPCPRFRGVCDFSEGQAILRDSSTATGPHSLAALLALGSKGSERLHLLGLNFL